MAKTVQQLVAQRGYVMALFDSDESQQEIPAVNVARKMYASGILLGSIDIKSDVIDLLLQSNIPVVGLNAYQQYPFDTVHVAGCSGSYLAMKHLIALGHKHIAFAGGTPHSMIGQSRMDGYLMAMEEARLPWRDEDRIEIGFSQDDGYEAGNYFAKMQPLPTAICCANDQIALGLLCALHEKNIQVPRQISVTGMDDISYSRTSNPSLTSVTNDSRAFSREGVRMLFERIDGLYDGPARDVAIAHELIVRASTCSPTGA
ncbi:MAG: substrate-binding domain-containing protein [Clostridia bacterium]